jgi:hypothetical protein
MSQEKPRRYSLQKVCLSSLEAIKLAKIDLLLSPYKLHSQALSTGGQKSVPGGAVEIDIGARKVGSLKEELSILRLNFAILR